MKNSFTKLICMTCFFLSINLSIQANENSIISQGELRSENRFGITVGSAGLLLLSKFDYNYNDHFSFGVGFSSGRVRFEGNSSATVMPGTMAGLPYNGLLISEEKYDYSDSRYFLFGHLFPFKKLPLYLSVYFGRNSGTTRTISETTINFNSTQEVSQTVATIDEKPAPFLGSGIGFKYFFSSSIHFGFEIAVTYSEKIKSNVNILYSRNQNQNSKGVVESFASQKLQENLIQNLYANDRMFYGPVITLNFGVNF